MEARRPFWEVLPPTFLPWQPTVRISQVEALLSPADKCCLERQIRAVVQSMGFSVKANVDLNPNPVTYWLCDLGQLLNLTEL